MSNVHVIPSVMAVSTHITQKPLKKSPTSYTVKVVYDSIPNEY